MATIAARPGARRARLVWRNTVAGWSFILPNFIGFAVLTLVPVGVLFYIAFTKWNVFRRTATGSARTTSCSCSHDRQFWTALTEHPLLHGRSTSRSPWPRRWAGPAAQPEAARAWRSSAPPRSSPTSPRSSPLALGVEHAVQPGVRADQRVPAVHRHRQPTGLDRLGRLVDAGGHHRGHLAGDGLLHAALPRRPADDSRRSSTRRRGSTVRTPGSGSGT